MFYFNLIYCLIHLFPLSRFVSIKLAQNLQHTVATFSSTGMTVGVSQRATVFGSNPTCSKQAIFRKDYRVAVAGAHQSRNVIFKYFQQGGLCLYFRCQGFAQVQLPRFIPFQEIDLLTLRSLMAELFIAVLQLFFVH